MPPLDHAHSWNVATELPFVLSGGIEPAFLAATDPQGRGARDDVEQALRALDTLRPGLPELRVSCFDVYRALRAAGQPDARAFLERAHAQMMAQAAALADPARRERFLTDVAINRAIRAARETET